MIKNLDMDKVLNAAKKAALIGREILQDYFGRLESVTEKKQMGLVSEADQESEKAISTFLRREFPEIDILGEESSFKNFGAKPRKATDRLTWIIDPLDGTTNYIHQFPIYCVSIGLGYKGEVLCGVIDVPVFDRTYWAVKGRGAFVNGERLQVSERKEISELLLATGFSSINKKILKTQLSIFSDLVARTRGIRRAGSAAYDMCLVAEGVFDGYWEMGLQPWDTAGGTILVREAGGVVTNFSGKQYHPFLDSVLACNPKIHKALLKTITSAT